MRDRENGGEMPMFDFSVLREIRLRENKTLSELSAASGVSVAVISKLERNQSQAEVATLFKLGRVLGLRATDILTLAEAPLSNRKKEHRYESGDFAIRAIRYQNADCLLVEGKAGAKVSKPDVHADDHEICWVLSGSLRLDFQNETQTLQAGEGIQFDAIQEHSYVAVDDCQFIISHVKKAKRY